MVNAMNIKTFEFAEQLLKIVGKAVDSKETKKAKPDLEKFTGRYWSSWGESIIIPWKDGLASFDIPTDNPLDNLAELKHIEGNTFRRVRKDSSDDLGEEVRFESGPDGKVTRVWWHQNFATKML